MGTILGISMPYFGGPYWDKWIIMAMPPGAFFMLGIVVWVLRSIELRREREKK
jgi:Na+-transporting NADH:ubiquinone oxidoreductase subunit D